MKENIKRVLEILNGDHIAENKFRLGVLGSQDIESAIYLLEKESESESDLKIHIHFNNMPEQICALKDDLKIGQTATVHFHETPDGCEICPNGHCHAPNVTLSRIDAENLFLSFEDVPVFECDIKDLPLHESPEH